MWFTPWKLHFDGSMYKKGLSVGIIIVSPNEAIFEVLKWLDQDCNNNQAKYETLLFGLEILHSMDVKNVEEFGDLLWLVQQVSKVC
jgi:ribonuclease HI